MLPAQSPQRVVSKICTWSLKNVAGAQSVAGQCASGLPHPSGTGVLAVMSLGMEERGKNQTEMPLSTHCTVVRGKSECDAEESREGRGGTH